MVGYWVLVAARSALVAPVAFDPDVAAWAGAPVAFNPVGSAVGRLGPVAANPDVTAAVPAVVARLPNPAGMRRGGNDFYGTRGWRSDADDYLSSCCDRSRENESSSDGNQTVF